MRIIQFALVGLMSILAIVMIFMFTRSSNMVVEATVEIGGSSQDVIQQMDSLSKWKNWAIWATNQENDENLSGTAWEWTGYLEEDIHGFVSIDHVDPNRGISGLLYFKSQDTAEYNLFIEQIGNSTQVTWHYEQYVGMNPITQLKSLVSEKIIAQILTMNLEALKAQMTQP